VTLSLFTGNASRLELPSRSPRREDGELRPFDTPEAAPALAVVPQAGSPSVVRELERDLATGRTVLIRRMEDSGRFPGGLVKERNRVETCSIVEGDPLSASVRSESKQRLSRGPWSVRIETRSHMTCDRETFHVSNAVDAFEGETRIFAGTRSVSVPRDAV
jgi:uncharacterized protein